VKSLISPEEVQRLLLDYEDAIAGRYGDLSFKGKHVQGKVVQLAKPSQVIPGWSEHAYRTTALAIARQLHGDDLDYRYDQIIMKPPHYPAETAWHQDAGYWKEGQSNVRATTCWMALGPVFKENGALQFMPGSHKEQVRDHFDASDQSEINNALATTVADASAAVAVALEPGDATFHHCRTLHFAGGNFTDVPRRGLITHFHPAEAKV